MRIRTQGFSAALAATSWAAALIVCGAAFADTSTPKLGLTLPSRASTNWDGKINGNFTKIDNRENTDDARHAVLNGQVADLQSAFADAPEGYKLSGTFHSTAGTAFDFTDNGLVDVGNVNEYVVVVTPLSASANIGVVAVEKEATGFTVKCSGADASTPFEATLFYLTSHNTYGNSDHRAWYASPDASIADQMEYGEAATIETGSIADIAKYLEARGMKAKLVLPASGVYPVRTNFALPANAEITPDPGAVVLTWKSIRSAAYQWTQNGETSEYYLELAGGGDPGVHEPGDMMENAVALARGAAPGELEAGQWAYGDCAGGFQTVFVRLSDSADPDERAADFVTAGWNLTIGRLSGATGLYQWVEASIGGGATFAEGGTRVVRPEWFGAMGEGEDDTAALRKAFASAPANSTVELSATYLVSGEINPNAHTRITASGGGGLASKPSTDWNDRGMIDIPEGASGIFITGATFDGRKSGNPEGRAYGVIVRGASNITIEDCTLKDFPTTTAGNAGDGVYVGRGASGTTPSDIRVVNNTISGNERQGISVTAVNGMLVQGNGITGTSVANPGAGMDLEPNNASDSIRDVRIVANRISGNAGAGVLLYNGNNYVIDEIVIADNRIRENGSHGIHVYRAANGYTGVYSIAGNIIRANAGDGIFVDASKGRGMVVSGNTVWENGSSGIEVEDSRGFIVNANSICHNALHGILVDYIYGGYIEGNISANTIMNNSSQAANAYDGIHFSGNATHPNFHCIVTSNAIGNTYGTDQTQTQRYGIQLNSNSDHVVIDGNWTFNNLSGAVYDPGYTYAPMGFNYDDATGFFGGDQAGAVQNMNATGYTISDVGVVLANASSGEIDPRLSPSFVGRRITVVKTDASANKVVVRGQPSETVGGAAYFELHNQYDYVTCVFIGDSKWAVVANN